MRTAPESLDWKAALDPEEWHGVHGWHPVLRIDMSVVSRSNSASIQSALGFEMANLARGWADRGVPWGTDHLPPLPQGNDDPAMALRKGNCASREL